MTTSDVHARIADIARAVMCREHVFWENYPDDLIEMYAHGPLGIRSSYVVTTDRLAALVWEIVDAQAPAVYPRTRIGLAAFCDHAEMWRRDILEAMQTALLRRMAARMAEPEDVALLPKVIDRLMECGP